MIYGTNCTICLPFIAGVVHLLMCARQCFLFPFQMDALQRGQRIAAAAAATRWPPPAVAAENAKRRPRDSTALVKLDSRAGTANTVS